MTTTENRLPAEAGTKPTNPKDAIGTNKLPLHLWPTTASALGCVALAEGMLKYGRTNWREAGVRASIYVDAAKRHLDAWFEGEPVAPDSGVPHLGNVLACIAIIVDAQAAGKLIDDRAYNGSGYRGLVEELTPIVAQLRAQHADKSPRHFTIADTVQQDGAVGHRNANPAAPDHSSALAAAKCDGNHAGPQCADPECWNDGPIALILDELRRAVIKFPTWPTDPLHALAVLGEEFGELTKATLQTTYEPHKSSHDEVRTEAIQTAAMALRFVISLDRYEYAQGVQHQQEGQPA
jgi:hypothetical protein